MSRRFMQRALNIGNCRLLSVSFDWLDGRMLVGTVRPMQ
jgi:hypothetical protein